MTVDLSTTYTGEKEQNQNFNTQKEEWPSVEHIWRAKRPSFITNFSIPWACQKWMSFLSLKRKIFHQFTQTKVGNFLDIILRLVVRRKAWVEDHLECVFHRYKATISDHLVFSSSTDVFFQRHTYLWLEHLFVTSVYVVKLGTVNISSGSDIIDSSQYLLLDEKLFVCEFWHTSCNRLLLDCRFEQLFICQQKNQYRSEHKFLVRNL